MHIFLTGRRQVGKSTLIDRALARFDGVSIGGFRTVSVEEPGEAGFSVYITPGDGHDSLPRYRVGLRRTDRGRVNFPDAFDRAAGEFPISRGDIILMDELGFMENEAELFKQTVLDALAGNIPVLGVLKSVSTPFLDRVRSFPGVEVIEVTEENRDELLPVLVEKLGALLCK